MHQRQLQIPQTPLHITIATSSCRSAAHPSNRPGHGPRQTSSFSHRSAHYGAAAAVSGGDGCKKRRGTETESGERWFCCNVMLNSNMQCSNHGNGGSSEAWCRDSVRVVCVYLLVSAFVPRCSRTRCRLNRCLTLLRM